MPRRYSIYSPNKLILNSVRPENDTSNVNIPDIRKCSQELFQARLFNARRSFNVTVTPERIIHVKQYVQRPEHLLDKVSLQAPVDNSHTAIVLFLIHGVGGSSEMWDPQIQYFLHEGYEIVCFDMLGHGLSSKPTNYKAYKFRELAVDVLHVFDIFSKKRNVLIGHSYGSSFCTLLSKERGSFISKMALISGGGPTSLMPETCSTFCLPFPLFFMIRPTLVKMFRRMAFHSSTSDKIRNKTATFAISAFILKAIMQGQFWPEADEEFHADLLVPVLLLYGEGDKFVSLEDEIWMNETIYGSELEIIENAGHMVTVETPSIVNHLLHHFLNRDPSTRLGDPPDVNMYITPSSSRKKKTSVGKQNSQRYEDELTDITNLDELNKNHPLEKAKVSAKISQETLPERTMLSTEPFDHSIRRGSSALSQHACSRPASRVSQISRTNSRRKTMF